MWSLALWLTRGYFFGIVSQSGFRSKNGIGFKKKRARLKASPVLFGSAGLHDPRKDLLDVGRLELLERFRFNLPDTLPGHGQALADLFQRTRFILADAKPQANHELLARGEGGKNPIHFSIPLSAMDM